MELQQQVVSRDLAKRLKELAVSQEAQFYYATNLLVFKTDIGCYAKSGGGVQDRYLFDHELVAAFTVAELGEILPDELFDENEDVAYTLTTTKCDSAAKFWTVFYHVEERGNLAAQEADTEADARAKMLIYLIEQGLLTAA